MSKISPQTLLSFTKGDQDAFEQVYSASIEFMYRVVYRLLLDEQASQDVVQNTYIKLYKNRTKYDPAKGQITTWLYRIASNEAKNYLRRRKLGFEIIKRLNRNAVTEVDPYDQLDRLEQGEQLQLAIDKLHFKYREIWLLKEVEELSYAEIAEKTGIALGTVRSRLSRARELLKKILE